MGIKGEQDAFCKLLIQSGEINKPKLDSPEQCSWPSQRLIVGSLGPCETLQQCRYLHQQFLQGLPNTNPSTALSICSVSSGLSITEVGENLNIMAVIFKRVHSMAESKNTLACGPVVTEMRLRILE